ncbi:hypothetical protein HYDPIDRAFT_104734 [Hydnomerulius pinastri MD-312]|nr:hypothetical protein HYDPIDRAFT_104734 [Hydnomerulius pinastri MD-312]
MLVRHACRTIPVSRRTCKPQLGPSTFLPSRRTFITSSTINTLSESFLDLAIALPIPPSWPAYSTTIILGTVLSRLVFTVPFSVWAKRRQLRVGEKVLPVLQAENDAVANQVVTEMRKERLVGTKEQFMKIHRDRVQAIMKPRRKELFKEHHCQPWLTNLLPIAVQLPLFVVLSMVFRRLSENPTPFDSESFLTLSTLAHPDSTAALPIAIGLLTFANVESSRWFMTDAERAREVQVKKWTEERVARGEFVIQPMKMLKSGLRYSALFRTFIALSVPGGLALYWTSSAAFGLVQTWILESWATRRTRRLQIPKPPPPSAGTLPVTSGPRSKKGPQAVQAKPVIPNLRQKGAKAQVLDSRTALR